MKEKLDEFMDVGGGQTGTTKVPSPEAKTATLPNSKKQGDLSPQKLEGEVQDTDSQNNTKPTGDMSAKNKSSVSMKEDMEALFGSEDLTEEFKEKASTIFEAAVHAKIEEIKETLEEEYNSKLEEQVSQVVEDLNAKVDDYMNYVVAEWMENNEVAITSTLRAEIAEEFIGGLKTLFTEHYIDVPEDKVDVLEELSAQVEELEAKLNDTIEENINLAKSMSEFVKEAIFTEVSEGLAATQVDKFKTLAEGVEFNDEDTFRRKLEIVKENYFSEKKVAKSNILEEEIQNADEPAPTAPKLSGVVANYVSAISRTVKK